jgi:hypothetical protein
MTKTERESYILNVENRITPEAVAAACRGAIAMHRLPVWIQTRIAAAGARSNPDMGFVVEPYSLFLAYEIDPEQTAAVLPPGYEYVPVSMFRGTAERYCAIVGCFNVHTSVFAGTRFELYVIARSVRTSLVSWVMCGYESNTIHYDPGKGFLIPTTTECTCTTSFDGSLICSMKSRKSANTVRLAADMNGSTPVPLNRRLWVEGNLSVDYAGELDNKGNAPFGLVFDPGEMDSAQRITPDRLDLRTVEFGFITSAMHPFEACYFPYAQHYLTTVLPRGHEMKDEADLEAKIRSILAESGVRRLP